MQTNVIFKMSEENKTVDSEDYACTPPPIRKIKNPFDKVLIGRLHMPICSPGMCKIYKKQTNGSFKWEIDQACALTPADIVACSSQFEPTPDPALEKIAEEATEKFFSQEMVMPSPIVSSKNIRTLEISSSIHVDTEEIPRNLCNKNASSQTILTLPPVLPVELDKMLQTFCTFTEEQNTYEDIDEVTSNGSLKRKLFFEEHSIIDNYDSEQTDEECISEKKSTPIYEHHSPVNFSPDLGHNLVTRGMKRTFGTPLQVSTHSSKSGYRNKILESVDIGDLCFSPIMKTPDSIGQAHGISPLACVSISPVKKTASIDQEKKYSSPESEVMATCLDCASQNKRFNDKENCFCKTPRKSSLRRCVSLNDSPRRCRRSSRSLSEKRSLSMSSTQRNRSVQKLDFSLDMSIEEQNSQDLRCTSELGNSASYSSTSNMEASWSMEEISTPSFSNNKTDDVFVFSGDNNASHSNSMFDDTPIKSKNKTNARSHILNNLRTNPSDDAVNMSLDNLESNTDNMNLFFLLSKYQDRLDQT